MAGWLGLVLTGVVSADRGWAPRAFQCVNDVPMGDKVGHFFLIGTLAWLLNRALLGRKVSVAFWQIQLGGLIVACLMTLEETTQLWIPGRSFGFGDLAANYAGIVCAGFLTRRFAWVPTVTPAPSDPAREKLPVSSAS